MTTDPPGAAAGAALTVPTVAECEQEVIRILRDHLTATPPPVVDEDELRLVAVSILDEVAAAERERELVLVWRDERGEEIARCPRLHPGTQRIAIPLDAQHCDLIAGDSP